MYVDTVGTIVELMLELPRDENGFSIVRQTNVGLSQATDYQGNILAATNRLQSTCVVAWGYWVDRHRSPRT